MPPSLFSFALADALAHAGDPHRLNYWRLLLMFGLCALGANICYSFAYALEFGKGEPTSRWMRFGPTTTFVSSVILAMVLAFLGAVNIAQWEFYFQAQAHHAD